jgi:hypothetical protein
VRRRHLPLLATATALLAPSIAAASDGDPRTITARLTGHAPVIDGVLDEAQWRTATPLSRFVQRSPREGEPPAQRTELRVLSDGRALYVGLRMLDTEPQRIRRGLSGRDNIPDSDWVTVYLDPLLTGVSGYFFKVNASGVMADGLVYRETTVDNSWDAVWTAAARVDRTGWTAELAIPLTSLAFQDRREQRWGIYVERYVQRIQQLSGWPAMPKSANTFVSRFGRLEGLRGLRRRSTVHLRPYAAAEVQLQRRAGSLRPDDTFRPGGGVDLHYGHGGELMVHLSINPDFGQVEEDAAVVNLSPTEAFFAEKRPFFVAGADRFTLPIQLLHTRRIGARPVAPGPRTEDGEIVEVDPEARIASAAKAVGEVGIASYGVLSALVLPSGAVERSAEGALIERQATPGRHYGAGRMRFRLGRGSSSSVGLMMTGMTHLERDDIVEGEREDAYAGGVDWNLRSRSGWQATGQLTGATSATGRGYGLWATQGQQGAPRWRYWLEVESFSRDYDINDVGYQWRADMVRLRPYVQRLLDRPWRRLRDGYVTLWAMYAFNHTDPEHAFDCPIELETYGKLRNLWGYWLGGGYRIPAADDRETRGGPVYLRPWAVWGWVGGETDTSRRLNLDATLVGTREDQSVTLKLEGNIRAQLWDRLNLRLYWRWRRLRDTPRWVETVERPGGDRYFFGDMDQDELDLELFVLLGVSRALTLQVYGQLLHSVGCYDRYRELFVLDDGRTTLGATEHDSDADFSTSRAILNVILRWDLGAGAAAYLVYKLDGSLDREGSAGVPGYELDGALSDLASRSQDHHLLLKISYGWNI